MNLFDVAGLLLFGSGLSMLIFRYKPSERSRYGKDDDLDVLDDRWRYFLILFSIHPMALGVLSIGIYSIVLKVRHYQFEFNE
ncbi:MAG: hypothetical protein U5K79_17080 [Cyclobacteriaceae bacterium]|nr:hypothetical protein [Cyclobacteriaceae bacterium]